MDSWIHPALFFFLGALLLPLIKGKAKKGFILLVPVCAIVAVAMAKYGSYGAYHFVGVEGLFGRVDKLSMVFAWVFVIMAFLGALYALHREEDGHHMAGFFYVGASLGAIFAGDYLTLFIFWEIMAFSSVFLIWYRKEKKSIEAGFRYLLFHVFGGLLFFTGMMLYYAKTGSFVFTSILPANASWPEYLILAGFALNAAVLPLHAWLPDAYPEASVEGAVFLCAFTTKTAVYVLARGFTGFEILAIMGTAMTVFGVCYAVIENDIRRVLAYHIISQVGYMVAGVGIGTEMAVNGASAHAFAHILYKALLFMGAGAVLYVTGTAKLTPSGRAVQVHAAHDDLLRRGGRLDLGAAALQRVREQVDDRRLGPPRGQDLADAAPEPRRDRYLPLRRSEGHLLRLLRQGDAGGDRGHSERAPEEHALGHGADVAPLLHHRRLPAEPVRAAARSRWTTTPTTATTSPR